VLPSWAEDLEGETLSDWPQQEEEGVLPFAGTAVGVETVSDPEGRNLAEAPSEEEAYLSLVEEPAAFRVVAGAEVA